MYLVRHMKGTASELGLTTRWWQGSFSISSEKGKIMERHSCKELLEKRWRHPRDDPCLMYKPTEKLQ